MEVLVLSFEGVVVLNSGCLRLHFHFKSLHFLNLLQLFLMVIVAANKYYIITGENIHTVGDTSAY